jgi:hypothetical protein
MAGVAIVSYLLAAEDIARAHTAAAPGPDMPMAGQDIDRDLATVHAQALGPATYTPTPAGRVVDARVDGPPADIPAADAPAVVVAQAVPGNRQ